MTSAARLCVPVLSVVRDMRQTRKLYSCLVSLRRTVLHSSSVSPHCARNYFISTPPLNRIQVSQHLNPSVLIERNSNIKKRKEKSFDNAQVVYAEEENEYFHNCLSSEVHYKSYFLPGCKDDTNLKSSTSFTDVFDEILNFQSSGGKTDEKELLPFLDKLACLPTQQHLKLFRDEKFNHLCNCLVNSLPDMTDKVYFKSMATLSKFNFRQCITSDLRAIRIMIAKSYDAENIKRMSRWDARQMLLAADFYFCLRCTSLFWVKYLQMMFSRLFVTEVFSKLGKEALMCLMLHASLARQIDERHLNDAMFKICQQIDLYSIEELGVVSLAYFKTNQIVKNPIFQEKLAAKLGTCVDDVQPICLSAVLKCLQKSTNKVRIRYRPTMLKMMVDLEPRLSLRMPSLTPQTALHVMSIFHSFRHISECNISSFSTKLAEDDLKTWRLKDLALAVRLLADLSQCFPSEILDRLVNELMLSHRENEITSHLDYLSKFLLGMAMAGKYSVPLLEWLFRPESLDFFADHRINVYRDLYQLSESVRIECPEYTSSLLPDNLVRAHAKKSHISGRIPRIDGEGWNITKREELMQQCLQILEWVLGGWQFLRMDFLLPHYQTADIELCIHPSRYLKHKTGELLSHPFDLDACKSHQRVAMLLYSENSYYTLTGTDGLDRPVLLGNYAMKRRQLKQLGFTIIEIPFFEYSQLDVKKKHEYILNKVKMVGLLSEDHVQKLVLPTK